MKKYLSIIFILISSLGAHSQSLRISYIVNVNTNAGITSTKIPYNLDIVKLESAFYNTVHDISQFPYANKEEVEMFGERYARFDEGILESLVDDFYYKDYRTNSIIYNDRLMNKKVVVKEALPAIDWQIQAEADTTILGYRCQKAIGTFRGRTYQAYFSPELNPYGGPWKFDGLPGLILSVSSQDNYFTIYPTSLTLNKEGLTVMNKYSSAKNILSRIQFIEGFEAALKKALRVLRASSDADGGGGSITITDRIEDLGISSLSF